MSRAIIIIEIDADRIAPAEEQVKSLEDKCRKKEPRKSVREDYVEISSIS